MQAIDSYGKQKVDWTNVSNAVILIGVFIATISAILLAITTFVVPNDSIFFAGVMLFGLFLIVEGTIASFIKVK
jgi:hypothetical protein